MRPSARSPEDWERFRGEFLDGDEADYQRAVQRFADRQAAVTAS